MDAPEELGGKEFYIGDLKLQSDFTSSKFGDEKLFFRHQNLAFDHLFKPEWAFYTSSF